MNAPAPSERPVVFRYLDARKFLTDAFEYAKSRNAALSHRFVAKAMGASSSGFFKDILNGRVRISPARAGRFAKLFKLTAAETAHFETLVQFTQADAAEEKEHFLERLTAAVGGRDHVLEAFQLEYFRKWHYAAVREVLAFEPVRAGDDGEEDLVRIATRFEPPLKPAEVAEALRLLLRLKLIRRNAQGLLERSEAVVRSGSLSDPARMKPAIRENIELALRALETLPVRVRPFSYLTLSVSEASLGLIREKVATLRRELLDLAARDDKVDRLYQVNIQMFPLTGHPSPGDPAHNTGKESGTGSGKEFKKASSKAPGKSSGHAKTHGSGKTAVPGTSSKASPSATSSRNVPSVTGESS